MAFHSVKIGLREERITLPKLRYESTTSIEEALLSGGPSGSFEMRR